MVDKYPDCCGEVVKSTAGGADFFYCRGCKEEVGTKVPTSDQLNLFPDDDDMYPFMYSINTGASFVIPHFLFSNKDTCEHCGKGAIDRSIDPRCAGSPPVTP